ncbi:hypothetical protein [Paenibacillus endoradicis]|uniref:hypothetical protein n=1 Tax=Paenibacillus endoradicis TaxID=2972487 RepID=UPI0021596966|nr:hypothetical protein [Paenibacillus endoradicis]MCR8655948.1 hypothetical protein [Paenibacillus endoradicis]MCR8658274.1 hypothetical protein [Paenibacillus endoradicis]
MSYIKQLETSSISLIVPFKQLKSIAEELIEQAIQIQVSVNIESEELNDGELRILANFDDSQLSDEEVRSLSKAGFASSEPYRNADTALDAIFVGRYDIQPTLGDEEDGDYYFIVEIEYNDYQRSLNRK